MPLRALMAAVESFNEQFPEDEETAKFSDAPTREEWEAHKASMTESQRAWHAMPGATAD